MWDISSSMAVSRGDHYILPISITPNADTRSRTGAMPGWILFFLAIKCMNGGIKHIGHVFLVGYGLVIEIRSD